MKSPFKKASLSFAVLAILLSSLYHPTQAQILNKIKERVKQTAEDKILNKAGEATDRGIDKILDPQLKQSEATAVAAKEELEAQADQQLAQVGLIAFANYDFVPGDKLIYAYDMFGEKDAEIPGRMLINEGSAEIQSFRGEKVLFMPANGRLSMSPFMKERTYLPSQFTFEFDLLSEGGIGTTLDASEITVYFRAPAESRSSATAPIKLRLAAISGDEQSANYGFEVFNASGEWVGTAEQRFPAQALNNTAQNWRHIAIYVNENIGKLYVDQHRVGMINQIEAGKAGWIDIEVNSPEKPVMFRNFRLAAGGSDSYKKVISEGKFIAYGIGFDVNKAVLKPESMGTINEFVKMMKENPDLRFEIGGHTDSDGSEQLNQTLSQQRAEAVKAQMLAMGIAESRLSAKGYGTSKPLVPNDSAENKARNRRVEFVKK